MLNEKYNKYPLWIKNFPGSQLKIVPVRIVDIIDDYFVIEYQSGKHNNIKQDEFIKSYISMK